jgi:hypothetical protein
MPLVRANGGEPDFLTPASAATFEMDQSCAGILRFGDEYAREDAGVAKLVGEFDGQIDFIAPAFL